MNDRDELEHRYLRDIVALSTLPAMWSGAKPARIAESLAASLFTTLDVDVVFIAFSEGPDRSPVMIAQTDRYHSSASLAAQIGPMILEWAPSHDPDDILLVPDPSGAGEWRVTTRSIGYQAELGVIAAAFSDPSLPTSMHHLMLNVAATQAATAIQNVHLLEALRHSEERLRNSNEELARHVQELQRANAEVEQSRRAALTLTGRLQELAKTARLITSTLSLQEILERMTHAARAIIPAHYCVTNLTVNDTRAQPIQVMSLSEAYAARRHEATPDGLLERHPVSRGSLAVPLTGPDGVHTGRIELSDKLHGAFTEDDEALLVQLAQIASVAIANARLYDDMCRSKERLSSLTGELEQRVHERTADLVQSQTLLRALASELNLAEQRERKRIATELHDHLQQLLVLSKLKLAQGKRLAREVPVCADILTQTDEVLTEALAYTRTLVAELSPPVLREHGLPAALKWLADYMKRHDMTVTVTLSERAGATLPEDQRVLLFQSVRELLINASKHAGTNHAAVTLEEKADLLRIEVRDEGRGFDPSAAAPAADTFTAAASKFGLFSLRERMRALGGRLDIESSPGKGTCATLVLPVQAKGTHETSSDSGMERHDHVSAERIYSPQPSRPEVIRVLLVDDHAMMRQGLRTVLESYADLEVIGEASSGEEAVASAERLQPSVVVMDINMGTMNGIDATMRLKEKSPAIKVIGLSVNAGPETCTSMVKAGAVALITKEAAVDQLYMAIQQAVKIESLPPSLAEFS